MDHYNQALTLIHQTKSTEDEAPLLHNIGVLYGGSKQYPKALEYYERALALQRSRYEQRGEASTLANIGAVHEEQGNLEKALDYYEKAINIQEKIRTEARLEEFKIKLAEQSLNVYVHALLISVRLGRTTEAFELSEQARARAFLDQMGNARVDVRKGAGEKLIQKEQKLRLELASLERQRSHDRAQSRSTTSEAAEALEKQLIVKREEYEDFLIDLKLKAPEYASSLSVDPLKVPVIQGLLDKDTTLISYFVTLNTTIGFVITRESFHAVLLPIKGDSINAQIVRFRSFADLSDPHPQPLKELYRMLISPLEPHIKTRRVGIISHSILHYLPFAALLKGEHYFGDDHEIFYLPSASVLSFAQRQRKPVGSQFLALGHGQAQGLTFLPFAVKTADDVAQLYETTALTDARATETSFRERVTGSNIVFIAAHGKLNKVNSQHATHSGL